MLRIKITLKKSAFISSQANRIGVSTLSTSLASKIHQTGCRNGGCHGLCVVTKAKMAVEGDVIGKEAVSVNDKNGWYLMPFHQFVAFGRVMIQLDCYMIYFENKFQFLVLSCFIKKKI